MIDLRIEGEVGTTSFGVSVEEGFLMIARKLDVENSVRSDESASGR